MANVGSTAPLEMSLYEQKRWKELEEYWSKDPKLKKLLPARARKALDAVGHKTGRAAERATGAVVAAVPERAQDLADQFKDSALIPVLDKAVGLLELLNDWIKELSDPEAVLKFHRERGRAVNSLEDLKSLDLKDLDEHTRWLALRMRAIGASEGAGLGALAMIPVPVLGSLAAISLDIVAMQALATALAIRICHAYGFDASDPEVNEMVDRIVRGNFRGQAPKATLVHQAGDAFADAAGRVRWSDKLRKNHRLMREVERLLKFLGGKKAVSVRSARMGMPVISVLIGAGTNQQILASTALRGRNYVATRLLCEKYDLPMPEQLTHLEEQTPEDDSAPEDPVWVQETDSSDTTDL